MLTKNAKNEKCEKIKKTWREKTEITTQITVMISLAQGANIIAETSSGQPKNKEPKEKTRKRHKNQRKTSITERAWNPTSLTSTVLPICTQARRERVVVRWAAILDWA